MKHYLDARELRIGNLVKCEPLVIPRLQIEGTGIMRITGEGISMIEQKILHVEPIELTEEILVKAGFKIFGKHPNCTFFIYKRIFIIYDTKQGGRYYFSPEPTICDSVIYFYKYIHQLQNLIFALIGEELNIEQ